jgi:uridine phosphorylase
MALGMITATRNGSAGAAGGSVATGASVAATGASVTTGASVAAGAAAPQAVRIMDNATTKVNNHVNFFIFFSLFQL